MIFTASQFADAMRGTILRMGIAEPVSGYSIDTRTMKAGDAFFAIQGPTFDGHDFLSAAITKGARIVVVHKDPAAEITAQTTVTVIRVANTTSALQAAGRAARARARARIIGVTGSNGKTTTKEMLASILRLAGKTLATAGNLNNHLGLPLTLLKLEEDHRYAVIEMGTSMPKDMDLLADLTQAEVGLITNVGHDHLEFFGTPDGVLAENRKLYDRLPQGGLAVIPLDDSWLAPLAKSMRCRVVTYSLAQPAAIEAKEIRPWPWPMRFTLVLEGRSFETTLNVIGTFQVHNAMAAAAVAFGLGISGEDIVKGLAQFQPAPMRMQVHSYSKGATLVNDAYNANPSSVRSSISSFCDSFPETPKWIVLADMRELGTVARKEHDELGRWLADRPVDRIILYGRDTRFIEQGLHRQGALMPVERFRKKRLLLDILKRDLATQKPAVLFKASRSMRLEQVVQGLLN